MPFNEGYEFLKESNIQYNLRSQLADELTSWASYYNISDETDLEARQRFLENVKPFQAYLNGFTPVTGFINL